MLPFLQQTKKVSSGIIETRRTPDDKPEQDQDDSNAPLEACAEDILRAMKSGDAKHLAHALQAAYDICESAEPKAEDNEEQESVEPHSYESQR